MKTPMPLVAVVVGLVYVADQVTERDESDRQLTFPTIYSDSNGEIA